MTDSEDRWIYWLFIFALILSLGVLFVGVFRLSVIRQQYYKTLARDNRIVETSIPAARGKVLDRKGRVIAQSVYQYFKKEGDNKVYVNSGDFAGYQFEGKDLAFDLKRQYLYGESMGSIVGYVGKTNDSDLKNGKCGQTLDGNDLVGRMGAEDWFDCQLRGRDGKRLVEVDAKGKYVREMGRAEPEPGSNLNLSIDAFWQDKVYKMLEGKKGVVIMSRPDSGKIITLVSSPGFDPNVFSYETDKEMIKKYLEDGNNLPMLNRTIAGNYHPGSTFKIVMATAGLESGVINSNSLIEDTGIIKIGDYSYSNWLWTKRGATDGMVDIVTAIKRSNDIFFYKLGEGLGVDRIKTWANKYGFGQKTGVELAGEVTGLVPDNEWKLAAKGERWFLGNTYHLSIGQGDLGTTPIQVNQMTNVIANGGSRCKMTIVNDGRIECQNLDISQKTLELITEGMKKACHSGGTAWPLFNFKTEIACKTGTAEVGDGSKDTHAWLTAFAPADDPEISITVMIERGGEGSDTAAPIVGDILKEWFNEPETVIPRYQE